MNYHKVNTHVILQVLAKTCSRTLLTLDLERSQKVTDFAVDHILLFINLVTLSIFNTGISNMGQAKLLRGLRMLERLPRGDFLCEALEYLEEEEPEVVEK